MIRFMTTWRISEGLARMSGRSGASSVWRTADLETETLNKSSIPAISCDRSMVVAGALSWRVNVISCDAICAARSAVCRISSTSRAVGESDSGARSACADSACATIAPRRLLKSWAIPAARTPTLSSF